MRLKKARTKLASAGKLPFLVSNPVNLRYLCGFDGSYGFILFTEDKLYFITDSRYAEHSKLLLGDECEIIIQKDSPFIPMKEILAGLNNSRLFYENMQMTCYIREKLSADLGEISMMAGDDFIERMRIIKDDDEISLIRSAARIAVDCIQHVRKYACSDITEWELSVEIEKFYRYHGCRRSSFDSIVASGSGSSMPHYIPSMTKKIESGSPLMIDMGCFYSGYNSDLTRTFFVKNVSADFEKIYETVLDAQCLAVNSVRPGITSDELDAVARNYISDKGYGGMFGHSLGHGVGMEVHELPSIKKGNSCVLEPGMIITVEPGIYIAGKGGVRIEDMVLVTSDGGEILTDYSKDLTII